MFKNLNSSFERRKKNLSKAVDKHAQIEGDLSFLLKKHLQLEVKNTTPFKIDYRADDNSLTITADNKIIANELSLNLDLITDFLKNRKINLSKILIR